MRTARIGELNQRIAIEKPVATKNGYGEDVIEWKPMVKTWAAMRNVPQREPLVDEQLVSVVTTTFMVRYRTDVSPKMRIVHRGKIYQIEAGTDPDGAQRFTQLQCSEYTRGGAG